jgi:uncharacterized phage protein gp47/JayE
MDFENIYAEQTYENIQSRKLARVPSDRDKRQGSVIFDATSTNSVEVARMYIELIRILRLTFAESSFGEYLRMRTAELGVFPRPAVNAERLGIMYGADGGYFDIPIGTRFSIETLHYTATKRRGQGHFELKCETTGIAGNQFFGRLIPVDNIRGLVRAELTDILITGADEENDDSLYTRFEERVNMTPFGGNVDDYVLKVKAIEGVGGCEVYPVRRGGGTGDIVIIDSLYNVPSQVLIDRVQEIIDPLPHQTGLGFAPLDHNILILGVEAAVIDIEAQIITAQGAALGHVQEEVKTAINAYFLELRRGWERRDRITPKIPIVIRTTQLISVIINIKGIEDVRDIKLNGQDANLTIGLDEIPFAGVINLYE